LDHAGNFLRHRRCRRRRACESHRRAEISADGHGV
jgi:hypothetical protein